MTLVQIVTHKSETGHKKVSLTLGTWLFLSQAHRKHPYLGALPHILLKALTSSLY